LPVRRACCWQLGQIALIAGIVSLVAPGIMLILSVLGFLHLRRTPPKPNCCEPGNRHDHRADLGSIAHS